MFIILLILFLFSIFFENLSNFEGKIFVNNENKPLLIFKENKDIDEIIVYDLIRIFNFHYIFVDTLNYDINSKSLIFLVKYIKYLNIKFDNRYKKIIDIAFKDKSIEEQFKEKYENTFALKKAKNKKFF